MSVDPAAAAGSVEHAGKMYYFCGKRCVERFKADPAKYVGAVSAKPAAAPHQVTDPVCGMKVDPSSAAGSVEHQGTTYYFCSEHCIERFRTDPAKYLHPSAAPESAGAVMCCPERDKSLVRGGLWSGERRGRCR